jgi:hypothetical protein
MTENEVHLSIIARENLSLTIERLAKESGKSVGEIANEMLKIGSKALEGFYSNGDTKVLICRRDDGSFLIQGFKERENGH